MLENITSNLDVIISTITGVITVASILIAGTRTPAPDTMLGKIYKALEFCKRMYETPTSRAYKGMASMLDRLARYMETTQITAGRDGNINSLVAAAKNFDQIRASFKGVYKDLQEEQSSKVRGGIGMAYDQ
mgnify:CR=1 FL=1